MILEIKNLSKTYKSKSGEHVALDNVSATIKKGEFVAVSASYSDRVIALKDGKIVK